MGGVDGGAEVPQRRARCYNKEKRRRRNGISGKGAVRGITTNTGRKVSSSPGPGNAKSRDGEEEKHSAKWRERRKEPVHAVRPCARACPRVCARARVCVRVPACVCARQCRAWPKRRREPRRQGPGRERPAPSAQSWKGALCPQGFCKRQVLRRRARVILPNSAKCPLIRTWLESGAGGVAHSTCSQGGDFAVRISPRTGGNGWKHFWVSRLWDLYWPLVVGGQACREMPCKAQDAPSKEAPSPRHPWPPHGGALRWRRPS